MTDPARPARGRSAIVVHADSRDSRLYEGLVARGFRLLGFPAGNAVVIAANGVPMEPVELDEPQDGRAAQWATQIAQDMLPRVRAALRSPDFARHAQLGNAQLAGAVSAGLLRTLERHLSRAAYTVEVFDQLARQEDIRLLLLRSDLGHPMRALTLAARQHGIPSLHVMHYQPWVPSVAGALDADVATVYGTAARDFFVRCGVDPERLAITGNSAWDGYADIAAGVDPGMTKRGMGLAPDIPLVMLATPVSAGDLAADYTMPDWPWQHFAAAVRALGAVHRRRPLQVAIKLHPAEATDEALRRRYLRAAEQAGLNAILLAGSADPRHIAAADLLVCAESTIGVEALLLGRAVVVVRLGDLFESYLYDDERDGVLVATDEADLAARIEAALFDAGAQAELSARRAASRYRFNYLDDGRAWERVLQVVDGLLDAPGAERALADGAPAPLLATLTDAERQSVAGQHLQQARRELEAGSTRSSRLLAEQALVFLDPGPPAAAAAFVAGYAALQEGDAAAAAASFRQAVAADATQPAYHHGLAGALLELEDAAGAETVLRHCLELDPRNPDTLVNLAEVLLQRGARQGAVPLLERAQVLLPADAHVGELLAQARTP